MSKKEQESLFNFSDEELSSLNDGFDSQLNVLSDIDKGFGKQLAESEEKAKRIAKARVLCIRGKFAEALKIYEAVVDDEVENINGYIGILRVHSKNFTVYDGDGIKQDIEVVNQIARGKSINDEEYNGYLAARKKYFEKVAEDKKKKA